MVPPRINKYICRWSREEAEKNKEVQARELKIAETNSVTFQVNDIPEWGTLDKNLDQVQAIDQWFQGRFLLLFVLPAKKSVMHLPDGHCLYTALCRIQAKLPSGRRIPLYIRKYFPHYFILIFD